MRQRDRLYVKAKKIKILNYTGLTTKIKEMRLFKLCVMQKSHIFQISRQNFLTPVFHQKPGIVLPMI